MKILQITDTHLVPPGGRLFESDPAERLRAAVVDIAEHHADADLCVLSGDLAHDGDPDAYALLSDILRGLPMPHQMVVGNHDNRARLAAAFLDLGRTADGFIQSTRDVGNVRLIFLDTVDAGVHSGAFCPARAAWLDEALREAGDKGVLIFMHHPPMAIGMPRLDGYRILDPGPLAATLTAHANVRHIFFGHIHRPLAGSWHGIPLSALKGTNHQTGLDFSAGDSNTMTLEPASYAVIFVEPTSVIVHFNDFADESPRFRYDPNASEDDQITRVS
ncbi:MAG: phosphodiesterase [Pseudomonadota bacterium]